MAGLYYANATINDKNLPPAIAKIGEKTNNLILLVISQYSVTIRLITQNYQRTSQRILLWYLLQLIVDFCIPKWQMDNSKENKAVRSDAAIDSRRLDSSETRPTYLRL